MNKAGKIWNGWSLTARMLTVVLSLFSGMMLLIGASQAGNAVGLKENAVVTGNTITLGDVFYGLEGGGDKVLGPAPRPGTDMVLNARTLMRVAIALDVPWRPESTADQVVLSRAATTVGSESIKDELKKALAAKGLAGKYDLDFLGQAPEITLPHDQPATFDITEVSFDPEKDTFTASLAAPSSGNPIHRAKLSGKVERVTSIPVLRETLRSGTIIGMNDIEMVDMPTKSLNNEYIMNADELNGMTPRRFIHAGKPVQADEVEAPRIVQRGDAVTMVFQEGMLSLTAMGKALENGAKGDLIRVVNTASNRTVQAVVTAEREVTVQPN